VGRDPPSFSSDHTQYNPLKDTGRRVLRQVDGLNLPNRCFLRSVSPFGSLTRTSTDSSTTVGIPLGRLSAISHPHEGVTFNLDGSLSYRDATTEEFTQRMKEVHKEAANGTFKPNRVNDQLT
jgi:hypothetical protein